MELKKKICSLSKGSFKLKAPRLPRFGSTMGFSMHLEMQITFSSFLTLLCLSIPGTNERLLRPQRVLAQWETQWLGGRANEGKQNLP